MSSQRRLGSIPIFFFLIFLIQTPFSHAQTSSSQASTIANPNFTNPTGIGFSPQAFQLSRSPFGNMNFALCDLGGQVGTAAQDFSRAVSGVVNQAAGRVTASSCDGALPTPITVSFSEENRCGPYISDKTVYEKEKLERDIDKMRDGAYCAKKKSDQLNQVRDVLKCWEDQKAAISAGMESLSQEFLANLNNMAEYGKQVKAAVQAEVEKVNFYNDKAKSLEKAALAASKAVADLSSPARGTDPGAPKNLTELKLSVDNFATAQAEFENEKVLQHLNRVAGCLTGSGATDSLLQGCQGSTGELIPPINCILDGLKRGLAQKSANGTQNIKEIDWKKADIQTKQFAQRVGQMLSELRGANPSIRSISDLAGRFIADLHKYGDSAADQLIKEMALCDREKQREIKRELANKNLGLGRRANDLKKESAVLSSSAGAMIMGADGALRDVIRELYGQELNQFLDGNGCNTAAVRSNSGKVSYSNVDLRTQVNCLEGLQKTTLALINGGIPPGATEPMKILITPPSSGAGTLATSSSTITCQGLNDCSAKMISAQQKSAARVSALKGDGTFTDPKFPGVQLPGLARFSRDAVASVDRAFKQAASIFSARTAILKQQLSRIQEILGKNQLNILREDKNGTKPFRCKTASAKDEFGICEMPDNFAEALYAEAGAPQIDPDKLFRLRDDITQKQEKFNENQQKLASAERDLEKLRSACSKDVAKAKGTQKLNKSKRDLTKRMSDCQRLERQAGSPEKLRADVDTRADLIDKLRQDISAVCDEVAALASECIEFDQDAMTMASDCRAVAGNIDKKHEEAEEKKINSRIDRLVKAQQLRQAEELEKKSGSGGSTDSNATVHSIGALPSSSGNRDGGGMTAQERNLSEVADAYGRFKAQQQQGADRTPAGPAPAGAQPDPNAPQHP